MYAVNVALLKDLTVTFVVEIDPELSALLERAAAVLEQIAEDKDAD